jgi:FtsH-binding integral membrane protein
MAGDPKPSSASSDAFFKRMVAIFTALSLAAAYGWLAGFARGADGDFAFHWRWQILLWAVIGLVSTLYFWRKIWPPENQPAAARKDIVEGSLTLALPGLWWLIFPLRFLSGQHFWNVVEGLTIAAVVLTIGAFMIIRLGKAFENDDKAEIGSSASNDENSKK